MSGGGIKVAEKIIKMTVRLPKEVDDNLNLQSAKEMISKNALVVRACKQLIDDIRKQNRGRFL